jgi:hypothetical protein
MDVTTTAQVVSQVAGQQGVSPLQLSLMLGPLVSHAIQPVAAKIPASLKPALIAVGSIVAGALATSAQTGMPFNQALGYGVGTALAAKLYHLGVLKDGGALAALAQALGKPKQ